ncbi:sensor histidine kinase [Tessaracoccus antarcticus]|uniref:histidine kinase n=1 Tax=Tessaracoccus antarcticus TaxID=2479848 RepID=A0A3M0GLD1_9ACTN|nr:histidine kinase [Tessaracoccus antarcticus]RMB62433.1 sensor histidine kinase [Tessaracoccus antarcticus]
MSQDPDRRRRTLLRVQCVVGGLGALVIWVLLALGSPFGPAASAVVAAGAVALLGWLLVRLERRKWVAADVPADVDYARELREVRDSRRVIVGAFEIERRRIERDLHDGAQQYLVSATMKLGEAALLVEQGPNAPSAGQLVPILEGAHRDAEEALRTLRATVSGIHPQVLSDLGLAAAVSDMAERSGVDVTVRCPHLLPDMPEEVAAVAWFFCSEALTNVVKHAPGASVTLLLGADRDLHVSVMDNGPGGAWLRDGGGLVGMRERLAAFGGAMQLASPVGGPTTLSARIPLLLTPAHENTGTA